MGEQEIKEIFNDIEQGIGKEGAQWVQGLFNSTLSLLKERVL